jgi:hypothetical protein
MVSGIVSELRLMVAGSHSQLHLTVSVTVYHSYVRWYLAQSIIVTFDGIWERISAAFDGCWNSLTQLRLFVSGNVNHS